MKNYEKTQVKYKKSEPCARDINLRNWAEQEDERIERNGTRIHHRKLLVAAAREWWAKQRNDSSPAQPTAAAATVTKQHTTDDDDSEERDAATIRSIDLV